MELAYQRLKTLLLAMAEERSMDALLRCITDGLGEHEDVALARIWLIAPGDICETCPRREECARYVPCLQLVASAGSPRAANADWSRIDGDFRRFPIGARKIGEVGRGQIVRVEEIEHDASWIARPDWAKQEGVRGFGGAPLRHREEVLGVLGVFTRAPFDEGTLEWLQILADHAAAAIANARAFQENARLRQQLELENEYLRDEISDTLAFGEIVGVGPAIRQIGEQIEQVAPTDATVLILGESGTGKELVAREVHRRSGRRDRPMIRVNCASIPKELYESEFFGHIRGAFTGAVKDRVGRFAAADGGTLFLDEVGEIPLELQSKLLRVLQEGQYERVGDDRTRAADVRIVAATNRNLADEVKAGRFREDLFYRLDVFPLEVPPLRKRTEDIPLLAEHFLARTTQKLERPARLSKANIAELQAYDWPGNIRELQNAIERAVITTKSGELRFHLSGRESVETPASETPRDRVPSGVLTDEAIREIERGNLVAALERAGGKIYGAGGVAELLGLKPTTVASRIQRLGIKRPTPS